MSPNPDGVKVNFDVAFNVVIKKLVSGVIIKNSEGLIMVACTCSYSGITDTFVAKARPCEQAIDFVMELGFKKMQIEGDSLTVIKKVKTNFQEKSMLSPIIKDIKTKLGGFERISFYFAGRKANVAVHALVAEGHQLDEPQYWVEEAPQVVERVVEIDCQHWFSRK
ncbi:hypothetical protein Golob_004187 [Gossypium lobatum]|uniref:RNase H type-1 domain-containing protein n=1 Tax=Gossypium lobatum TaxID=34289 RepID=A0A7J8N0W1_9ROSI|nr:hypothetical protein [Gossypium lobatum]